MSFTSGNSLRTYAALLFQQFLRVHLCDILWFWQNCSLTSCTELSGLCRTLSIYNRRDAKFPEDHYSWLLLSALLTPPCHQHVIFALEHHHYQGLCNHDQWSLIWISSISVPCVLLLRFESVLKIDTAFKVTIFVRAHDFMVYFIHLCAVRLNVIRTILSKPTQQTANLNWYIHLHLAVDPMFGVNAG